MAADGQAIDALQERVQVESHLLFHWAAFKHLTTDRQIGFGVGPIPWTAIDRYAERMGITDHDEYDRFLEFVRALDRVFLEWQADERERTSK